MAPPLGITVRSLTGRMKKKEKETLLGEIGSGAAQIVVGTHALIEQTREVPSPGPCDHR